MRRFALVTAALIAGTLLQGCSDSGPTSPSAASSTGAISSLSGSVPEGNVEPARAAKPPAEPKAPTGATVDVPDSVVHDCSADVTSDLNSFFTGLSDNSTVRFATNGCYRIEDTVTLGGKNQIAIDGQGAQLQATTAGAQDRRHLVISDGSDITIRNLTVVGANDQAGASLAAYQDQFAFQHAFTISSVDRVLLENVGATRLHGDFVYIGGSKATGGSNDVTVRKSKFDGSGRQGISIVAAERVLIADNSITGVARSMFDIEPNRSTSTVRDIRITGNHTGPAVNFWLADKGKGSDIGDVEIDNNVMEQATGGLFFAYGPSGGFRGPWLVHDNQFIANNVVTDENSVGAFLFSNCAQIELDDNHVTFPPGSNMPAVELRGAQHVTLSGNQFDGASQPVLADSATTDVNVH